jgi:hypothetical protein
VNAGGVHPELASCAAGLRTGYEALRLQAVRLGPEAAPPGRGLALLLARGLVAWMVAVQPLAPVPAGPASGPGGDCGDLPDAFREELVQLLVSMCFSRKAG